MKEPELQRPGAKLPLFQRLIFRYFVGPFVSKKASWEDSEKMFAQMCGKIQTAISGLSDQDLKKKVLVPAQQGLEDSSRYWSIQETLEHILIVSQGMREIIKHLSHGKNFPVIVQTKDVKPTGNLPLSQVLTDFKNLTENHIKNINQEVGDKNSPLTHDHPWFGPFKSQQWFWIMGVHAGLHYKQVKEIIKGL